MEKELSLEDLLKTLPSQEGLTIEHNGKTYYRPYQTFTYKGETFEGLREMKERRQLFLNLIKQHNVDTSGSYLDIGCNMGYFPRVFSEVFSEVYGIDYNQYYTWFAKTISPELSNCYFNYDINSRGLKSFFGNEKFDFVTSLSMIEYINDKQQFVKDIFDLVKDNGLVVFEGHSMDINLGFDKKYENIIRSMPWKVERLSVLTDNRINAPREAKGRPVWTCTKKG